MGRPNRRLRWFTETIPRQLIHSIRHYAPIEVHSGLDSLTSNRGLDNQDCNLNYDPSPGYVVKWRIWLWEAQLAIRISKCVLRTHPELAKHVMETTKRRICNQWQQMQAQKCTCASWTWTKNTGNNYDNETFKKMHAIILSRAVACIIQIEI